jgi:hypothetical protein
MSLRVAYERTI